MTGLAEQRTSARRPFGLVVLVVFVAVTALLGLRQGIAEVGDAGTPLQLTVQLCSVLYGLAGILAAIGLWRLRIWGVAAMMVWAVAATATGSIAPLAYAPAVVSAMTLIPTALVIAVFFAALVFYGWRVVGRSAGG